MGSVRPDMADEVPDLVDPSCDRDGLAAALVDSLARLDQLFDAPMPYMMWVHQRPTDGGDWPGARVHVHVNPLYRAPGVQRYVASAEQGGGVYFDPVVPEDAAAQLRALPGAPLDDEGADGSPVDGAAPSVPASPT